MFMRELRSIAQEAMDSLYKDGDVVKALDESGEPRLRNGQQVYRLAEYATPAERTNWNRENKVN